MIDALRAIVARASSIHERTGMDFIPVDSDSLHAWIDARMNLWLSAAANGDKALFQRRLEWQGIDETGARRAVSPVQLRAGAALPEWASILREVLDDRFAARPAKAGAYMREPCLDPEQPIAFEDVLVPFVIWARSACAAKAGTAYGRFSATAHAKLERQLLELLSGHAARSLFVEFLLEISLEPLDLLAPPTPSPEKYRAFVHQMLSGRLLSFFLEYSALARVLAETTGLWVEGTVEMIQRFERDRK